MIRPRTRIAPSDVARHYDALDRFYRELWGEHLHHGLWETGRESVQDAVHLLVRRVAERAAISTGTHVCDIGCGYGATAQMLATDYGATVTGYTLSAAQHARAAARAARDDRLRFVIGDWFANGLPDASFDAIIAVESTEHMEDKPGVFVEAHRLLRPGGRLVVCAWLSTPAPRLRERRYLLEPICREGRLPSMGTVTEYREWIERAGFTLESYEDLTPRVRRTWTLCSRQVVRRLLTRPSSWSELFDRTNPDRVFVRTVFRILAAYRVGAMQYGIFTAHR